MAGCIWVALCQMLLSGSLTGKERLTYKAELGTV